MDSVRQSWNVMYMNSNSASITKRFFPNVYTRISCHHFYTNFKITQILTGHRNFKKYLNRFNLCTNSVCDCTVGGDEDVEHILFLCSKFIPQRNVLKLALKKLNINYWPPTMNNLISSKSSFVYFINYIEDTYKSF